MPSPCSSPPWNCLELTQPIGRPGDPGEGTHSTKPRRRFQETFSQYASRIWPRINKIQGPSLLAELEQETCCLRRSERESHRANSPQSSNCRIRDTLHGSGGGATNSNWKKENRDLFPSAPPEAAAGMGANRGGEPGGGIKIEPCRRKSRGVDPREISLFARAVSDGLLLWSLFCLVFGKHLVVFPFVCFFFSPPS